MLVIEFFCPQCHAALTENGKLHLQAHVRDSRQEGIVFLSAAFGDYQVQSDLEIADGAVVEFACPNCEASFMLPLACKLCRAPMASLDLQAGGYLEFCCRRGCKGHAIGGMGNIDEMIGLLNRLFDTPYD